jgi:hypothetical protein
MSLNPYIDKHAFRYACFEFELRFHQATDLPADKGDCFHGAFGQALARIGSHFRDYFYNPPPLPHWEHSQTPPRPYLFIPPCTQQTHYAVGETLKLGIILYGSAIDYFLIVFAALEHLGEFMGLGKHRNRFNIASIQQINTDNRTLLYAQQRWLAQTQTANAEAFFTQPPADLASLTIKHLTRLRLKADNELLQTPPPFSLFIHRLLNRINALASLYCGGNLIPLEQKHTLITLANNVQIQHSTLQWQDGQRYSQRTHSTMPLGGLIGETHYQGKLSPFLPWLNLGQWTGVGEKTSFGLGQYQLELTQ